MTYPTEVKQSVRRVVRDLLEDPDQLLVCAPSPQMQQRSCVWKCLGLKGQGVDGVCQYVCVCVRCAKVLGRDPFSPSVTYFEMHFLAH